MKKFIAIILLAVIMLTGTCALAEIDTYKYQEQIDRMECETIIGEDQTDMWIIFNDPHGNRFHIWGDTEDPEVIFWAWYVGVDSWDEEPSTVIELTEDWICVYEWAIVQIFEGEV